MTTPPPETDDELDSLAVTAATAGQRLDVALTEAARDAGLVLSRTRIKSLIEAGALTLDGAVAEDANRRLKGGEALLLLVPAAEEAEPQGEDIPLEIAYEDEHLVVVDKPAGIAMHPGAGVISGTLASQLLTLGGAREVEHDAAVAFLAETDELVVLSNDLTSATREVQRKGSLVGSKVVDVEDELWGMLASLMPVVGFSWRSPFGRNSGSRQTTQPTPG